VLIDSIDDQGRSWSTVGVSTNIIEASWNALVESLEYGLLEVSITKARFIIPPPIYKCSSFSPLLS
ncbi:MAG: alpha-isopropylmalate synthase regulatory domain-containing protein, partial [Dictyoglomus sp.]